MGNAWERGKDFEALMTHQRKLMAEAIDLMVVPKSMLVPDNQAGRGARLDQAWANHEPPKDWMVPTTMEVMASATDLEKRRDEDFLDRVKRKAKAMEVSYG